MFQGHRLRHMRERRGLSQKALGVLVGKDPRYISKLELNGYPSVTTATLARLVTALRVSADYLLGFSDRATLPRRRATSTPAERQHRQTAARPTPPASPDQTTRTAQANGAVAVVPRDQPDAPWRPVLCPHCALTMQPLADASGLVCPACHWRRAEA